MDTNIRAEHELHRRRLSRNIGLGIALLSFVVLVYGMTVVKVGGLGEIAPTESEASE
jgi:hypothetical protein